MSITFDPDLIHAIFKLQWSKRALERERNEKRETVVGEPSGHPSSSKRSRVQDSEEAVAGTSKKHRPTSANANALKLSCELLRLFVTEAVQRAAAIAEAEGASKIQATHLERILPQLLLDF